jgi:hypothetical protein
LSLSRLNLFCKQNDNKRSLKGHFFPSESLLECLHIQEDFLNMPLQTAWINPVHYTYKHYGLGHAGAALTAQYFQQRSRAGNLADTITFNYSDTKETLFEKDAASKATDALAAGHVYSNVCGGAEGDAATVATRINLQDGIVGYASQYAQTLEDNGNVSGATELRKFLVDEIAFLSTTKALWVDNYDTFIGPDGKVTALERDLTKAILSGSTFKHLGPCKYQAMMPSQVEAALTRASFDDLNAKTHYWGGVNGFLKLKENWQPPQSSQA